MKKTLSIVLSLVIMLSMCNVAFARTLTTNEVTNTLTNMTSIYSGKYWNGKLSEETLTKAVDNGYSNPNNSYSMSERERALGLTHTKCSGPKRASGCVSNTFGGATQCMGFARYIEYVLFGVKIPTGASMSEGVLKSGYTKYSGTALSNFSFQPGDYLNCPNHSAVVWKVEGDKVYVIQAKGSGGRCVIDYAKFGCSCGNGSTTESDLRSHLSFVIRPTSYVTSKSSGGSTKPVVCNHKYTNPSTEKCDKCGEQFKRETSNTSQQFRVVKNNVSIKSEPYDKAGERKTKVAAGEIVTASQKVKNMYGNIWYKVKYNGYTGYMYSGNLEKYTAPKTSDIEIDLSSYPTSLKVGSNFGLRGTVKSNNYKISKVIGYIMKGNTEVQKTTDKPNTYEMDVRTAKLNSNLVFGNLSAGNYTLVVQATDTNNTTVTVSKDFNVFAEQKKVDSSLSINLEKYPVTINEGSSFGLRGSVDSNYTIVKVRGYVKNSNGSVVLSSSDSPNSKSMNIRYADLNNSLVFNKLSAGNYTMMVEATDNSGRVVTATKNFTVKGKTATTTTTTSNSNGVTGTVNIPSSWDNLSIRKGPSTSYEIVGSMNQGAKCTVYPDKTSNGWYYVEYNGVWGYASGNQITLGSTASNTKVGVVNIPSSWDNLSIRTGPSTDYPIVGSMNNGVRCTVYPDKSSNGWYYVEYNGIKGYAAGNRINLQ